MSRNKVQRGPDGLPKWKNAREVARVVHRGNGLRLVMLSCGKDNCSRCNGRHRQAVKEGKLRGASLRSLFAPENSARVRFGKTEDKNYDRKPLHGPYWYLLRYAGRNAKQWLVGRILFGEKLALHSDKEATVVAILRGTSTKIGPEDFGWEPEGWTAKDREEIGGADREA